MYRGNYGSPAMGPGPSGFEGAMKESSVKKKKRVKTASSPADLLERIQKRLRSENFFDLNESDTMASPSSSNSRMKFNSNQQHNPSRLGGPGQANALGDMMLPRPLPPAPHPPHHSTQLASTHDFSYSGHHGNDYHHQQLELNPKQSAEAQSSNGKRNLASRLGPPALAGNEMHSGRKNVPFLPGLGKDVETTGSKGLQTVASFHKPSITDFLDESLNSHDLEPAQTDYWKYGVSESSSTSMCSRSSHAHSSASPATDSLKNSKISSLNTEFKSGRRSTSSFFNNAGRGQKNLAHGSTYEKDRSAYSGSDSSRRSHQKIDVGDYSSTSDKRGRGSSRVLQSRDSPARSRRISPFVAKSGRTGSLLLPSDADLGTTVIKSGRTGSHVLPVDCDREKNRDTSSKWEKRLSGYEKNSGNDSRLSKNWKRSPEGREKESTVYKPDDSGSTSDHASEIDIPREALLCHVCRLQNFSNRHAYNKHLQSSHHQHMFQLLGVRNDNLEAFKRAAAKLSSRALEYEVMDDGSIKEVQGASGSNFIRCSYCFATVLNTAVDAHNQLLQHKELVEFTRPLCCGIKFSNRQSYECHRNTTKHLAKKFVKEKEFISKVICQLDEETMMSKMSQPNEDSEKLSHNSLSIPRSTYMEKVLDKMDSDPIIQDDKSNYCLVCEVSVPEFRKFFHPSCSDHHENKHTFCTVNKSRIAGLIAKILSGIERPNKSANAGVSDQDKIGRYPLSSKLISHTEKQISTVASEIEGADDFEYDFKSVSSVADGNSKSLVETKQMSMSTSDEEKVYCLQPTKKKPASLECITHATSDIKAITEPTDMEIASSDGSVEGGLFEYKFSGVESATDAISAKPVAAVHGRASEAKQVIENEEMYISEENVDEKDEEFDYEFSSTVSELGHIVPPVVAVKTEKTDGTSSKLLSDKVSIQSRNSADAYSSNKTAAAKTTVKSKEAITNADGCRSSQKMISKTEKTKSDSLELGTIQNKKSKGIDEALEEFYVQFEVTDVLKGAAQAQQKIAASSANKLQAQEEKDIDDEIDDFDYQFDAPASEQSLPTAQTSTLASSIDTIVNDNAAVELELVTTKLLCQKKDNGGDETNKDAVAGEANTEEDEFEYLIAEEKNSDDGHLNNKVAKTNEFEEKAIDGKNDENISENSEFDYQVEEKKSSEEDQFEYQMEEETDVKETETVIQAEKDTTGEDEFEYEVEEDVSDGGEFEYQLDDNADDEFECEVEEKCAEEDEFEYQIEDKDLEVGKINKISPVLAAEKVSNVVQDEPIAEDKLEYQTEPHDLKESKGNKEKHAKNVKVTSKEMDDEVAQDSDFDYEMEEETKNENSVKDKDDEGGDEFEYQLEDDTVAEEDKFDCKLDENNMEKGLDTNVEEDEFEYNIIDESDGVENTDIPNTGDLCEGTDPSEFGEEEEFAFDYELPDDEVDDDPKQLTAFKKCAKEASKENATQIVDFAEKDSAPCEDEFDYDVEEYETEISTVSRALGKVSDEVKQQIDDDNNSSDENTSSNLSSEKIESAKSSPLKFKIPPVAPYSSDAAHDAAVDPDLCENVKSVSIPSLSDEINFIKSQEEMSNADSLTSSVASPARVSASLSAINSSISPERSLEKSPVRMSTSTQSRSPAIGSATSPAGIPPSYLNIATDTSPIRASTSSARDSVASPTSTATSSADLVTEAKGKVEYKEDISEFEDSVVSLNKIVRDDIEDKEDIKCTLPIDSKIAESSKIISEQDVLSDQIGECNQAVQTNREAVKSMGLKSIEVEIVESTPVKVDVDSENVKKISGKYEDDEATSKSRISKGRARSSRSTPVKTTVVVPLDDSTEAVVPVSQGVGAKRGRTSTHSTAGEDGSQECEELPGTRAKRPARNRSLIQKVKEEDKETVEILLEVIDEEPNSSPQKKGKASRRNTKGRTILSSDSDNDASETLPASNHGKEDEEDMKEDEEKMTSPRARRGGRARRGNSTRVFPKRFSVSIDAEVDPIDEGRDAGGRKRRAPTNSDDEGSECSAKNQIDEEPNSSPQKKGKASRRNTKGRTILSSDSDDDASETLPASNHGKEEEEDMKEAEEKMTSPRARRGGKARRGNSTRVFPKRFSVSIDAEVDPTDEERDAGGRKRGAPTNSDDEGSECSVTSRPSKRGRGGTATRGTATPKTPGVSSRKTAAVTKTPAVSVKATPVAVASPKPGSGGKGKQTSTPATELRSKRRSCVPVRYE